MKTFLINNKKTLLACLTTVFLVATMCCFVLGASAFAPITSYTATFTENEVSVEMMDDLSDSYLDSLSIKGTSPHYSIAVNDQVYGSANTNSTISVAGELLIGALGESTTVTESGMPTKATRYYLYYQPWDAGWRRCLNSSDITSNKATLNPLKLTNTTGEVIPYTFTVVKVEVNLLNGSETLLERSAYLTVNLESAPVVQEPTKTGYIFTGWYLDEDCTIPFEDDTFTSDVTLYAGWEPISYTISFDGNGSTGGTMDNVAVDYDETLTLPANGYTKEGYKFLGWATTSTSTTVAYANEQSVSNLTAENNATVYLYAIWKENAFTITYNANGGVGTMQKQKVPFDVTMELSTCTFTKEGYNFKGWATSPTGAVVYTDAQEVSNIVDYDTYSITLYAVWEIQTFTITFIVDGEVYYTTEVEWGTKVEDVIAQSVDSLLYEAEEGGTLPN